MENSLMHYGRKGMKWGQHIYGGKKSASASAKEMNDDALRKHISRGKLQDQWDNQYSPEAKARASAAAANKKTVDNLNEVKNITSNTATASREAKGLSDTIGRIGGADKKAMAEMRTMSDTELRNRINRMNMEQQYANLNPSKVSRGAQHVGTALGVMGSVAAIASAGLGIAVAIKQLKG